MNSDLLQIPKRIKELREILEIPVDEMATGLEITAEEYEKLESGEKDIPISILYKIAELLGIDCTVLMTGDEPKMGAYTVVRNGEGVKVDRYEGYSFESLAYNFKSRSMNPMLVTLNKKDEKPHLVSHGGQEFNYVILGEVKVTVGRNSFVLKEGDSIYFDPTLPHGQEAVSEFTKFITVINE